MKVLHLKKLLVEELCKKEWPVKELRWKELCVKDLHAKETHVADPCERIMRQRAAYDEVGWEGGVCERVAWAEVVCRRGVCDGVCACVCQRIACGSLALSVGQSCLLQELFVGELCAEEVYVKARCVRVLNIKNRLKELVAREKVVRARVNVCVCVCETSEQM